VTFTDHLLRRPRALTARALSCAAPSVASRFALVGFYGMSPGLLVGLCFGLRLRSMLTRRGGPVQLPTADPPQVGTGLEMEMTHMVRPESESETI
jgi:hypothetical protein